MFCSHKLWKLHVIDSDFPSFQYRGDHLEQAQGSQWGRFRVRMMTRGGEIMTYLMMWFNGVRTENAMNEQTEYKHCTWGQTFVTGVRKKDVGKFRSLQSSFLLPPNFDELNWLVNRLSMWY